MKSQTSWSQVLFNEIINNRLLKLFLNNKNKQTKKKENR